MQKDIVPSYHCKVMEVISGDDLIVLVDLNIDDLFKRVRARLRGVDTPSAYKENPDSTGGKVRADVHKLTKSKQCRIDVHSQGRGGWVVTLFIVQADGTEVQLNSALREQGFVYQPRQESRNGDTKTA